MVSESKSDYRFQIMVSLFVVPVHSAHGQRGSSPFESQSGSVRGQKID